MKRLSAILLFMTMCLSAGAFDFQVRQPAGYALFFNVIDDEENAVEVTSPVSTGNYGWQGYTAPSGVLEIPAQVEHDGVTYTVVAIGERAFLGCAGITAVVLPTTVVEIGPYAFYQCSGIKGKLTIGENIVSIGRSAFYGCSGITEVAFNAVACETMGGSKSTTAFGNCRSLSKVSFGPKVRIIPDYAFMGMDLLTCEWNMPQALEYVGEYAFAYCYSIYGKLTLPASVRKVSPYAFAQCHSLLQVDLPAKLSKIDNRAFYQCINLREITVRAIEPPTLDGEVFGGVKRSATLNVPCISEEHYAEADEWKTFQNRKAMQPCTMELNAVAADPQSGSVTGTGTYPIGSTATIAAICRAGYSFRGWQDGNTDNPRRVTVKDTTTYVATMVKAEVIREVEYVHDTTYMEGVEVIYEYYEIGDVAEPLEGQKEIVYDKQRRRIEVPIEKSEILGVALYNDAGVCVSTGLPRRGHINMRRFPSGYYIVRISTPDNEQMLRFFHNRNK